MMNKLAVTCILLTIVCNLFANGGGIAYYGVNGAGNPYFKDFPEVKILREDLLITPVGNRINVCVTYLMNNTSAKKLENLHYAFPIDFWCQLNGQIVNDNPHPEKEMAEAIKYVEFICNGETLQYKTETPKRTDDENWEHSVKMRTWYFTAINLPQGVSQLIVNYSLKSESSREMGNLAEYANFSYDFSPAGTFGDATIKEFAITIDAIGLANNEIKFEEGSYLFNQQAKVYTYTQSNFDLKKAQALQIQFSYQNSEAQMLVNRLPANDLIIKTSSSTSQYPVTNLTDLDFGSAFIFSKNGGVGEWIEITAKNKIDISSVFILPGYYKSEEAYRNNNRIKKVLVEYISCRGEIMTSEELQFPDKPYQKLDYSHFSASLQNAFGVDYDYFEPMISTGNMITNWMPATVRITILEIYQGEKFKDTCLSEIFVMGN